MLDWFALEVVIKSERGSDGWSINSFVAGTKASFSYDTIKTKQSIIKVQRLSLFTWLYGYFFSTLVRVAVDWKWRH